MESLVFNVESSELLLSMQPEMEMIYLAAPAKESYKLWLKSGGSVFDYTFKILVRGSVDSFAASDGSTGTILATVEKDVVDKRPLIIHLNVTNTIFNQLIELHKSNLKPKSITLDFDDELSKLSYAYVSDVEEYDYVWDNLCKFRVDADSGKSLPLTDYKFNY